MSYRIISAFVAGLVVVTASQAAEQSTVPTPASAAAGDKVRCKRFVETGSLAKVRKECHTQAEWQRMFLDARQGARDMLERGVTNDHSSG